MFWNYGNTSSSQIEAVLAKKDVTLQELMDEEDIINECKVQNKTLMEFLVKPDIIEELITLTILEPSSEVDECARFKYSNIACEILTCDVPRLNERLAGDEALLSKLYGFIEIEPPLNPLLASFFSKIMGVLIAKKAVQNWLSYQMTCLQVLDFLKAKENFIPMLLKHMGTSAIMDLTLKLMTQVEGAEVRQNNLNWLNSQQIMQSLVSLLDPSVDTERHYNVAQLLCDFIKIARENLRNSIRANSPDPLLDEIESPQTVSLLLDHMLSENKTESCIVGGIQVLLALLDLNRSNTSENDNDVEQKQPNVEGTTFAVLERLGDFHLLLLDPPKKKPIITTLGVLDPPLGNTRLQITKLFAALISIKIPELMQELITLGTFQVLLDLFFQFPWNNFLHTQVQICITSALEAAAMYREKDDNALYEHLIFNCKLIERILEAWKYNDVQQTEHNSVRQGYMGHLTVIVEYMELCLASSLGEFLKDNAPEIADSFKTFCEATLPSLLHNRVMSLAQESFLIEGYKDFSNADSIFTEYQTHPLAHEIKCTWRLEMDEWKESEDKYIGIDHLRNKQFDLSEGISLQSHELFKQVCSQNINTLDDVDDQIFEDRDHTFQTVIEKPGEHNDTVYSSDSDEEDEEDSPPDDPFMILDGWQSNDRGTEAAVTSISMGNVWSNTNKTATDVNNIGWANFNSTSFANFEANFDNAPNDLQPVVETDLKVENVDVNNKTDFAQENHSVINENINDFAQFYKETVNASDRHRKGKQISCNTSDLPHVDEQLLSKAASEGGDCKLQLVPSPKIVKEESEQDGV